jgi:hypothetical protein
MLSPKQQADYNRSCQVALDCVTLYSGNLTQAAEIAGVPRETFRHQVKQAKRLGLKPCKDIKPLTAGRDHIFAIRKENLPKGKIVRRYLLTCAQNNTKVNDAVWKGLKLFAGHMNATIYVSRFMYNTSAFGQPANAKPGTAISGTKSAADLWYDPAVVPHICDERVILAPGLAWCGEVNIRPTAVDPLSGFEAYTGRLSGIFPHAKIAMRSIASGKNEPTKFNFTTGTVTQRNYIQRKEGLKAEFHHAYGALLVEVDSGGNWWCRQINVDKTGTFYDLDVRVHGNKLTTGHRVEAITWGDVHVAQIDPGVGEIAWGKGGMLDALRPKYQFFHDVLDMQARGHHNMRDPHKMFDLHVRGKESVATEVMDVAGFFKTAKRAWVQSIVVPSNHHEHMLRWLKEADWRRDPVNAEFFIDAQAAVLKAIRRGDKGFDILNWAVERAGGVNGLRFLAQDESFITCKRAGDGVENGMHGHLGPNGARPSPKGFANMGRKSNVGHSHSAGIYDGVYIAGTSSLFDLSYNRGPSSWSHSHIVTYPNGKRAIVTMWRGKWRA